MTALTVLVLYDDRALATCYVREHLESLQHHSRHAVFFASAGQRRTLRFGLEAFDAVVLHFSIRLAFAWHLAPTYAEAVRRFAGAKLAMIQDEYDSPKQACRWIRDLGIRCVFTTTRAEDRDMFYPRDEVGDVEFVQVLTGYVPEVLERRSTEALRDRPILVGYRGRELPYWYGRLGREKQVIGEQVRRACERRGMPCDIAWDEERRIAGEAWWEFLARCRVMLGTESGANVVDWDGSLKLRVEQAQRENPCLDFETAFASIVAPHEGRVRMNQVPPKVFEAVALRTALVLFEGEYSGVLTPETHYIPLRKDFANLEDVLDRVGDTAALEAMVERAHRDIVRSGRYAYSRLTECIDRAIERHVGSERCGARDFSYVLVGDEELASEAPPPALPLSRPMACCGEEHDHLLGGAALRAWHALPVRVRAAIRPGLAPLAAWVLRRGKAREVRK